MQVPTAPGILQSDGGISLIMRIREPSQPDALEWIAKTRIIAISGSGVYGKGALKRAEMFGADLCLAKPVGSAALLEAIRTLTLDVWHNDGE